MAFVRHEFDRDGAPAPARNLPVHRITCDRLVLGAGAYGTTFLPLRNPARGMPQRRSGCARGCQAERRAGKVPALVHLSTEQVMLGREPLIDVDETRPCPRHHPGLYAKAKAEAERLVLAADAVRH